MHPSEHSELVIACAKACAGDVERARAMPPLPGGDRFATGLAIGALALLAVAQAQTGTIGPDELVEGRVLDQMLDCQPTAFEGLSSPPIAFCERTYQYWYSRCLGHSANRYIGWVHR